MLQVGALYKLSGGGTAKVTRAFRAGNMFWARIDKPGCQRHGKESPFMPMGRSMADDNWGVPDIVLGAQPIPELVEEEFEASPTIEEEL